MAEARFQIEDDYLADLKADLNSPNAKLTDLTREAYTLLKWAAEERKRGRIIASADRDGTHLVRLVMPSLERADRTGSGSTQ